MFVCGVSGVCFKGWVMVSLVIVPVRFGCCLFVYHHAKLFYFLDKCVMEEGFSPLVFDQGYHYSIFVFVFEGGVATIVEICCMLYHFGCVGGESD